MEKLAGLDISIRKTTADGDLEWCARFMSRNEPWITLKRGYEQSLQLLRDPLSEVYLLEKENDRVGFIMIKMKGPFCGYIQTIAVAENYRGKGIGEAAIRYIESIIFRTYSNVFICASSFNERAQKLYLRMGYGVIGVLKDYIEKGHDEILMRKTKGPMNEFSSR